MGETEISRAAEEAGVQFFDVFGWEGAGGVNQNWDCSDVSHRTPKDKQKQKHPSDAVFRYSDPYRDCVSFWIVDFKSYGAKSISKSTLAPALRSMVSTVECANGGAHWQQKYASGVAGDYRVDGLVFLYNHDGALDTSFPAGIPEYIPADLHPTRDDQRVWLLGPSRLRYLLSVATDIRLARLPGSVLENGYKFLYPDFQLPKPSSKTGVAAPMEFLAGPFLFLKHESGRIVYYDGRGECLDEFKLIFDMLFRLGFADEPVDLRMVNATAKSFEAFEGGKESFLSEFGHRTLKRRMTAFTMRQVTTTSENFSSVEVGMDLQ